ncbi:LysR family transcriptional regulator [Haloechinothrix salitolerans]|uniref:LysR family transcriptional regulator n=1 Tax=Haloechinothrix salitolerans TaxID=926830 RepID=A0ABW2C361_9PSEU
MTLQQLRYLVAVADYGSITAAAAGTYVAQPALSREGRRMVRLARTALEVIDSMSGGGHATHVRTAAKLRIVSTPTLAIDLASELIPAFARYNPDVDVEVIRREARETVVAALRTGAAEIGLVDLPVDEELMTHSLRDREVVLVSPPGTGLPNPVPVERLDGLPMVVPARSGGRRRELEELFTATGVRPTFAVETDERVAWVASVLDGKASLIWYRDIAVRTFGSRVTIRSFTPPLSRTLGIVHPRRPLARAARAFINIAVSPLETSTPSYNLVTRPAL